MYIFSSELGTRGKKHMEKKNINFTKDGMKVGVKELKEEEYADRQQKYGTRRCAALAQGRSCGITVLMRCLADNLSKHGILAARKSVRLPRAQGKATVSRDK
jgi:hypothetical protein